MLWRLFHSSKIGRYLATGAGEKSWALVTGSSDGIGKGVALELLARGFNVILHGRNATKLQRVRDELQARYTALSIDIFVWDASQRLEPGGVDLSRAVLDCVASRRVTVLVNNVGYTSTYHSFTAQDPMEIDMVVNLQIAFLTHITRALLPTLMSHAPGLVLNVGGLTGRFPCPYLAVHSGGKAYLSAWSRALAIEMELVHDPPADVEVLMVDVHNVSSNSNSSAESFFTPSAETMGRAIIDVVGCGRRQVTAYWRAELMAVLLNLMPASWMDAILAKEMISMRRRETEKQQ
ncbi:NAD(P)-binding protein [Exidia glandulosa HHB12029]|uniref:NAD(P)-binding protein n=1 Tax=Exidia glandulosa HHB12029 TaxID=1314781 RepID=A0A165Q4J7_EXIGL|nr:NAD(P)-binding protein [Exidia glandulosa HHB12029]